jgi:hypothetical protein
VLTLLPCGNATKASAKGAKMNTRNSISMRRPGPPGPHSQDANGDAARSASVGTSEFHSHGENPGAAFAPSDAKNA